MNANTESSIAGTVAGLLVASLTPCAIANPNVQSAQLSNQQGQVSIVISGSDFGNQGPSVVVNDSFESTQLSSTQWDGGSVVEGTVARTGSRSHIGRDEDQGSNNILRKELGGDFDDIYVSFWVRLGTDFFPGSSINSPTAPRTFPDNSSWKFLWLMDGSDGFQSNGNFDLCLPTHTGGGGMQLAGNDGRFRYIPNDWWSWTSWVRVSTLIQDKPGDYGFFQTLSAEHGNEMISFGGDSPFLDGVSDTFSYITMPGWMRGANEDVIVYYDDVYIAAGDGAAARIEIADSANYADATNIDLAEPVAWQDGEITAVLRTSSGMVTSGNGYLFVFDSSGQRNSVGFPLCSECPEIPEPF